MHRFDAYVARQDCISSVQALESHPNVKKIIHLPRKWILYEFHHPLFEDPDFLVEGVWQAKMDRLPELRKARIEMMKQQQALVNYGNIRAVLPASACWYRICALKNMQFLPLNRSADSSALSFENGEFSLLFQSEEPSDFTPLKKLLGELVLSGEGSSLVLKQQKQEKNHLLAQMSSNVPAGHWMAALWALLSEHRGKAGISGIVEMSWDIASLDA